MANSDIFSLGLGLTPPWRVIDQRLETVKQPNALHLAVAAGPGARFPCPTCGRPCKPHDWKEMSWRHLHPIALLLATLAPGFLKENNEQEATKSRSRRQGERTPWTSDCKASMRS